jgi:diketogulonate reductase-like aldo/keto reductase
MGGGHRRTGAWALVYVYALAAVVALADEETPCRHRETKKLRNGVRMPRVAFGTAGLPRGSGHEAVVAMAFNAGFRSFDTAQAYEWYDEGAVARALNATGAPRSSLFVTTKIHPRDLGYEATLKAVGPAS